MRRCVHLWHIYIIKREKEEEEAMESIVQMHGHRHRQITVTITVFMVMPHFVVSLVSSTWFGVYPIGAFIISSRYAYKTQAFYWMRKRTFPFPFSGCFNTYYYSHIGNWLNCYFPYRYIQWSLTCFLFIPFIYLALSLFPSLSQDENANEFEIFSFDIQIDLFELCSVCSRSSVKGKSNRSIK